MTRSICGTEKTYQLSQSKDSDPTPLSLPSKNHGIGTTLFSESSWDLTEREKDLYLYVQEIATHRPLSFGERMQYVVILNAINDLYNKEPRIRTEAESWFASTEKTYVFSFECICLTFNFEPNAVRKALVEKRWDHDVYKLRTNGRR